MKIDLMILFTRIFNIILYLTYWTILGIGTYLLYRGIAKIESEEFTPRLRSDSCLTIALMVFLYFSIFIDIFYPINLVIERLEKTTLLLRVNDISFIPYYMGKFMSYSFLLLLEFGVLTATIY